MFSGFNPNIQHSWTYLQPGYKIFPAGLTGKKVGKWISQNQNNVKSYGCGHQDKKKILRKQEYTPRKFSNMYWMRSMNREAASKKTNVILL
ncbi:MAG: hypothetical protein DI535_06350 [Citrobacter freundii]|nr:MAG: hypothetical protein DI535_06350 [Citrobacter freundii]